MKRWTRFGGAACGVMVAAAMLAGGCGKARDRREDPQAQQAPEQTQEPQPRQEPPPEAAPPAAKGPQTLPPQPPAQPAAQPPEQPQSPAEGDRTVQAAQADDFFLYLCSRCGKDFTPTSPSVTAQVGQKIELSIDCPLCRAPSSAAPAVRCRNCKKVFPSQGALAVACPTCRCTHVPPGKVAISCPACKYPFTYAKGQPALCPKCGVRGDGWTPRVEGPK